MKPSSPCKDCVVRHAYCHGSCDLYAEYRKCIDEYNRKIFEEREVESRVASYDIEKAIKGRKRRRIQ